MIDRQEQFLAYLDGELNPHEFAELHAWMCADPQHAAQLAQLALLDVYLRERFGFGEFLEPTAQPAASESDARRTFAAARAMPVYGRRTAISVAVAALVIGVLMTAMGFMAAPIYRQWAGRAAARTEDARAEVVAQLTGAHEAKWAEGQIGTSDGAYLTVGRRMQLQEGLAEITFNSGATVILRGPAAFAIESSNSGRLTVGQLKATVPAEAKGFVVDTPAARVLDLGTEFVMEVEPLGNVEIGVDVGVVQVQSHGSEKATRVLAGQVARAHGDGITVSQGTISKRFAHYIPGTKYGELVVQDDVENDGSWRLTGVGGEFNSDGYGQITRAAIGGTDSLAMISLEDDGGSKNFTSVKLAPGVYNVMFWMGNYTSAQFPPGMSAEMSTDSHPLADLLVHSLKPTPPLGRWARWTMTYEVPPGDPRIGETLRFEVHDGGGPGNGAFDALRIWHAARTAAQ